MREDETTENKTRKTEIKYEEESEVNEEKWERKKSWDKPGPFYVFFLVFCLFISAFDSSQPRDVDNMSDPLAFCFPLFFNFSFFFSFSPLRFRSLSLPLYLFFSSFYSMLLSISPRLFHMIFFDYCLPLFFLCPFSFSLLFVSFISFTSFLWFLCIMYFLIVSVVAFERDIPVSSFFLQCFMLKVLFFSNKYFPMGKC